MVGNRMVVRCGALNGDINMRSIIIAILCSVFLATSVVRADIEVGTYAPDVEAEDWINVDGDALTLAEYRGMVVVLFFWASWNRGGEFIMPLITFVNSSRVGAGNGVFVVGLTDSELDRVEEMLKEQKVFFPVGTEAKQSFDEYDIQAPPRAVIIDPNGKVAWSGWPGGNDKGESLVSEIFKVIEKTPPTKTHPRLAAKARTYLSEAKGALLDERFEDSYRAANKAFENALAGDELKTRCQHMLDLIDALARDKFAQAEVAVERREFDTAVSLLVDVRREFQGVGMSRKARKRLEKLREKYEEVEAILADKEDVQIAESMLAEALQELEETPGSAGNTYKRLGSAYELLQNIIRDFPSSPTADKAETILQRIENNLGAMKHVNDYLSAQECQNLLARGRALEDVGRYRQAREVYRQILEDPDHAQTIWAEEAARRLTNLP